jgi:peptidoglycan/xylan/chitin deacetylase (PgdA/CDA1 family)
MALPPYRVDYLPIVDRPPVRWPGDARVALWIAPNVEHYEYLPPRDPSRNPWPRTPHPEVQGYAHRDYGNRVGFWRLHAMLDRYHVPATVSLNLAVLDHYPESGAAMAESGWEAMSHGIYNTRYLHALGEDEERAFYRDCVDSLRRHWGQPLKGMLGPAVSNSLRTPDLMAEAGLLYHADWVHDDQPVPIRVASGRLVSVPYSTELNDVPVFLRHTEADDFARMALAQFERLWQEGEASGRVMCLALHPYLFGAPHRIGHLDALLDRLLSRDGVWLTTAGAIAEHFLEHHYDTFVAHAAALTGEGVGRAR